MKSLIWLLDVGKRTSYPRRKQDFYPTPLAAVQPLLPHLPKKIIFDEPCAGDGSLVDHLEDAGHRCIWATDINPRRPDIGPYDVFKINKVHGDCFITNPPWRWQILNPLITTLKNIAPTFLLLNADVIHNRRMATHMSKCVKIISIGRVSWLQNNQTGFENCAWMLFDRSHNGPCNFIGRMD